MRVADVRRASSIVTLTFRVIGYADCLGRRSTRFEIPYESSGARAARRLPSSQYETNPYSSLTRSTHHLGGRLRFIVEHRVANDAYSTVTDRVGAGTQFAVNRDGLD